MSWHHIVMNHSSTADGGCVQQPAVLLTAETHSSEDTVWSHLSTTVSDNMSASWTRCTAHRINLFSCDSLLFSQRCCQFLLFRWSRGWPRSQNNVLIMFYKSYKYEFQECKWMIYIYIYKNWFKKNKMWNTSIKLPWSLAVKWIKLQLIQTYQINKHLEAPYTCILFNGQHQVLFKYWIAENYPWLDGSVTPVNTFLLTNLLNYGHF